MVSKFALKLSLGLDYIARAIWLLLMLLVIGNIITRAFGFPIPGTFELVEFMASLAIGLSLAYCAAQGGHVATTFLIDKLSEKGQAVADTLIELLVLAFLGLAVWRLSNYAATIKITGQVAQTTQIAYYPFVYVIAFGFAAYFLVSLGKFIDNFRKVVRKNDPINVGNLRSDSISSLNND